MQQVDATNAAADFGQMQQSRSSSLTVINVRRWLITTAEPLELALADENHVFRRP